MNTAVQFEIDHIALCGINCGTCRAYLRMWFSSFSSQYQLFKMRKGILNGNRCYLCIRRNQITED